MVVSAAPAISVDAVAGDARAFGRAGVEPRDVGEQRAEAPAPRRRSAGRRPAGRRRSRGTLRAGESGGSWPAARTPRRRSASLTAQPGERIVARRSRTWLAMISPYSSGKTSSVRRNSSRSSSSGTARPAGASRRATARTRPDRRTSAVDQRQRVHAIADRRRDQAVGDQRRAGARRRSAADRRPAPSAPACIALIMRHATRSIAAPLSARIRSRLRTYGAP